MRTVQLLDQRAWRPGTWITVSGIVLCPQHVALVCTVAQNDAVRVTQQIIERMMRP
jgi:hypothetical protein